MAWRKWSWGLKLKCCTVHARPANNWRRHPDFESSLVTRSARRILHSIVAIDSSRPRALHTAYDVRGTIQLRRRRLADAFLNPEHLQHRQLHPNATQHVKPPTTHPTAMENAQQAPAAGSLSWKLSSHPITLLTFLFFRICKPLYLPSQPPNPPTNTQPTHQHPSSCTSSA